MELETEFRRDVIIGFLLERKHDIETNTLGPDIVSPPIGRFHDSPPSSGNDDKVAAAGYLTGARYDRRQLPCFVIIAALRDDSSRDLCFTEQVIVPRIHANCGFRGFESLTGHSWLGDPRAPEYHHGAFDTQLVLDQFRFEELELQANRSEFILKNKIVIKVC
jgi:hypothetical protein